MARYKPIDISPRFLAVDLSKQLLPGSFEHALDYLIDHELDLSGFDIRYRNDQTGATAYPPAVLLKVILLIIGDRPRFLTPSLSPRHRTAEFIGEFLQAMQIELVVLLGVKAHRAVIAALNDVPGDAREGKMGAGT